MEVVDLPSGFVFEAAVFFQTAFADAPVQCVVSVHLRLFVPAAAFVSAKHFRFLQPVVQVVVQVVLAAVGQFVLDGVAVVVVVAVAVIAVQAVAAAVEVADGLVIA